MTGEVGVGSVYVGLQRAREMGNGVCFSCGEIEKECLSGCMFLPVVLYLFVNAHNDTPDPQGA